MDCASAGLDHDLLYVNFNQDYSCLSVGTRRGFRIYNCEPFGKCYERGDGAAGICEMLFSSSLIALVGGGHPPTFSPRKLQIVNTKRQTVVCELDFTTKVLAVLMNRKRLVVVLEERLHIYDLATMKIVHTIETRPNPQGICALSPSADRPLLAYPSGAERGGEGSIQVFNAVTLQAVCVIQAHRTAISKMSFNFDGSLLATSSDRGTIVRVFSTLSGQRMHHFRRGTYPATIHCLSFDTHSSLLCVTSDSDTVHIFKLQPQGQAGDESPRSTAVGHDADDDEEAGHGGAPSKARSSMLSGSRMMSAILPERMGEAWESTRDFAHLKLPSSHVAGLCAVGSHGSEVMVVTADGCLLVYSLDATKGGECKLLRKHSFDARDDSQSVSAYSL